MKKIYCFLINLTYLSFIFLASCQDSIEHSPYVDPNKQVANKITDNSNELPKDVFISEYFATDLGNFLPYTNNDQVNFEVDYNVAKVSGCIDGDEGKLYLKSEAWIIANTIDLSNQDSVYYSFDQIIAYESGNAINSQTLLISTNFNGDYNSANWDTLNYSVLPSTSKPASWDKFDNTKFYLDKKYLTSNVTFAFKYSSTEEHTSTWEIKNFMVKRGKITETQPYIFKEKQYLSSSTLETPASVSDVINALTSETIQVFVTGFVVGYVDGSNMTNARIISDPTQCGSASNILIADNPNETNTANCIPINLISGSQFRTVLNIKDNNDILGKQITLGGYVMSYMSANGLRNLFYSKYGDNIINNGPGNLGFDGINNVKTKVYAVNDTFVNNQRSFSIYNSKCSDLQVLNHIWTPTEKYGMKASAVVSNVAYESEAWFISPSIDLTKMEIAEFIFQHCLKDFSDIKNYCSVLISTDYNDGNPADANWTKLDISNWPSSTTFVENKLLLTDYKSFNNVHIAFKYTSVTDDVKHAGIWEIKTVNINEKEPDEIPISGFFGNDNTSKSVNSLNETFATEIGDFSIYDIARYAKKDNNIWYVDSKYSCIVAEATNEGSQSWLISPKIDASSFIGNPILSFSHTAMNFTDFEKELVLKVSEDYQSSKNPADYNWKNITLTKTPDGKNFTFVDNTNTLTEYKGKQFYFAFVYSPKEQNKPKWEIKNLVLLDDGAPIINQWNGDNNTTKVVTSISSISASKFSIFDVNRDSNDKNIWTITDNLTKAEAINGSESWLITPKIDASLFNDISVIDINQSGDNNCCKIMISANYDGNYNPNSANYDWEDITNYTGGDGIPPSYHHKQFHIAFVFENSNDNTVWKINSLKIYERGKEPGTKENPYNFEDFSHVEIDEYCYLQAYIVGCYTNKQLTLGADGAVETNIIVVASPSITNLASDNTISVSLNALSKPTVSLTNNPENIGKQIIIYGKKGKSTNKSGNSINGIQYFKLGDNEWVGTEPSK